MKSTWLLIFAIVFATIVAHRSIAGDAYFSLNLEFNNPSDLSSGGTWTAVGKVDDYGLAAVSMYLTNANFDESTGFLAPGEFEFQRSMYFSSFTLNVVIADDLSGPPLLGVGVIGSSWPSSYIDDPNLVQFGSNPDLGSFTGGVALATGTFDPGMLPDWTIEGMNSTAANLYTGSGIPIVAAANTYLTVRNVAPRTHVLSVGVNWGGNLDMGVSAEAFHDAIGQAMNLDSNYNTLVVYDIEEPSMNDTSRFFSSLDTVLSRLHAGDTFILYIATHGVTMTDDNPPDEADETSTSPEDEALYLPGIGSQEADAAGFVYSYAALEDDELYEHIADNAPEGWESVNKLFILDACHSGGFWGGSDDGDLEQLGPNTAFLSPAGEDTNAHADHDMGFFTQAIVDTLTTELDEANGSDNMLTISELAEAVISGDRFSDLEGQDFPIIGNDPVVGTLTPFQYVPQFVHSDVWNDVAISVPEPATRTSLYIVVLAFLIYHGLLLRQL